MREDCPGVHSLDVPALSPETLNTAVSGREGRGAGKEGLNFISPAAVLVPGGLEQLQGCSQLIMTTYRSFLAARTSWDVGTVWLCPLPLRNVSYLGE